MARKKSFGIVRYGDGDEAERRGKMVDLLKKSPIPDDELLLNLGLYLPPQALSRILFMDHLYQLALNVHGVVFDLGCRWGQNASLFCAMRGIYEPFNRTRKVVAFDTFAGHKGAGAKDGKEMKKGRYSVSARYEKHLEEVLAIQEQEAPLSHIQKFEVVKGDACKTVPGYLSEHKETIVSLAYFDFDIYKPTKDCLKALETRLTRGSVIGFDELSEPTCPGETVALIEMIGLRNCSVQRVPYNARCSFIVVE